MGHRRIPKTYKPFELQQAIGALRHAAPGVDPNMMAERLHKIGFRVVYVGHIDEDAPLTRGKD